MFRDKNNIIINEVHQHEGATSQSALLAEAGLRGTQEETAKNYVAS